MNNIIIYSLLLFGVITSNGCQKTGSIEFAENVTVAQNAAARRKTPSTPETPTPATPTGKIVEGYYPSWVQTPVAQFAAMNVGVINISLMRVQLINGVYVVNGYECTEAAMIDLINRAQAAGKKVRFSLGGAPNNQNGSYNISNTLKTMANAEPISTAIVNFCNKYNLDGVDCDFEESSQVSGDALYDEKVIELFRLIRQKLPSVKTLTFTSATPCSNTWNQPFHAIITGGHQYLTTINLMCYDWYWSGDPAYVYNYNTDVVNLSNQGVPKSKLVLGFMPPKDDFYEQHKQYIGIPQLTDACNYVKTNGLAGVMYWEMNSDHAGTDAFGGPGLGVDAVSNLLWNNLK